MLRHRWLFLFALLSLVALPLWSGSVPRSAAQSAPASEVYAEADFMYLHLDTPRICIFCDGSVHDPAAQREKDREKRTALGDAGYRVVVIRYDEDLETQIAQYHDIFGKGKA